MEMHEAGRKICTCTWHRWRIRHPCQQYRSAGLPINERIWVSLPKSKRKKKSIAARSYHSKNRHILHKGISTQTSLPEIQNSQSIMWPLCRKQTKWALLRNEFSFSYHTRNIFFLIFFFIYLSFLNLIPWEVARIHMRCLCWIVQYIYDLNLNVNRYLKKNRKKNIV